MKVAVPLAKNILAPLGITVAALAIDAGIQKKKKKRLRDNNFYNFKQKMNNLIEIVQALEDSNILLEGATKNETKKQKG